MSRSRAIFKSSATWRIALLAATAAVLGGCSSHAQIEPSIEFTKLPPSGQGSAIKLDAIEGRVTGAQRGQHIVLFARAGVWWVQPFEGDPLTTIEADQTWKNSTHPGNAYAALLVAPGYHPSPTLKELPQKGGAVLAVAVAEESTLPPRANKTIHFSGYEWMIREAPSNPGGTTNLYSPANAWTDSSGFLHLRISGRENNWSSGEVALTSSLGYGSYRFVIRDVSHLEPGEVFTISTWDDLGPSGEMNIEIGRWGEKANKDAQFVVQPFYVPANTFRFETQPGVLDYSFRWEPGRVTFRTARGEGSGKGSNILAEHVFTSGVPSPGNEGIHLNHYVFANANNPLTHGSEVIIEKFEYLP